MATRYIAVYERKKQVDLIISQGKKFTSNTFSVTNEPVAFEIMANCYVVTNGAIEFMVETILREWTSEHIKIHDKFSNYKGHKRINRFLSVVNTSIETKLNHFNDIQLDKIYELINFVAGEEIKIKFKNLLKNSRANEPDIDNRLEKIYRYRHSIAHGQKLPKETHPNLDELKTDFNCVYKHIIKNIIKALPRL
jgi:N-acetyl-anhydromuramyl-L-alanine amidase AmpD